MTEQTDRSEDRAQRQLAQLRGAHEALTRAHGRAIRRAGWIRLPRWLDLPLLLVFLVAMTGLMTPLDTGTPVWPAGSIATETVRAERSVTPPEAPDGERLLRGEVIVRAGDRVDTATHEKLELLATDAGGEAAWVRVAAAAVLIVVLVTLARFFFRHATVPWRLKRRQSHMVLSAILAASLLSLGAYFAARGLALGFELDPQLAAYMACASLATVLTSLLVDARTGLLAGVIVALVFGLRISETTPVYATAIIGVLVAGILIRRMSRRADMLKVGAAIGLAQAAGALLVNALTHGGLSFADGAAAGFAFGGGVLVALVAIGLLPIFELAFGEATEFRMLELASSDQPLLRKLALVAPGTHHHSVMVGNLAEMAADAIGADSMLCRVMALYHDIGKTLRPNFFVENQRGRNIHDRLAPELSARVLLEHVTHGLDLARQHRLGRSIIAGIAEHHGTSLQRLQFERARIERGAAAAEERDYHYPGPKPQSRETGLLLLADAVEASTRALREPTQQELRRRVHGIIGDKIAEGQLDECPLTIRDIAKIEDAFLRVLTLGVYHTRIEYPAMLGDVPGTAGDTEGLDADRGGGIDALRRLVR